jgi:hypothetical protein
VERKKSKNRQNACIYFIKMKNLPTEFNTKLDKVTLFSGKR